jgi:hypothetical protein
MTYTPPSGWVEPKQTADRASETKLGVFHSRQDCTGIRRPELLRRTEKPYTAARCRECAALDLAWTRPVDPSHPPGPDPSAHP